ncbi:hypothetical protein GCM10027262_76800 [Nocardia tengchongensis]
MSHEAIYRTLFIRARGELRHELTRATCAAGAPWVERELRAGLTGAASVGACSTLPTAPPRPSTEWCPDTWRQACSF